MNNKQLLVLPAKNGLSDADRDALREAGIIAIELKKPEEARLLMAERLPIDSNQMLRAVMGVIAGETSSYSEAMRMKILQAISAAIVANNEHNSSSGLSR